MTFETYGAWAFELGSDFFGASGVIDKNLFGEFFSRKLRAERIFCEKEEGSFGILSRMSLFC